MDDNDTAVVEIFEELDKQLLETDGNIELPAQGESPAPEAATTEPSESEAVEPVQQADSPVEETPDSIDYELEIPMTVDGEPERVKLGELKDRYQSLAGRESGIMKREAELSNEIGRLSQMTAQLQANDGPLTPEQQQQVTQYQAQRIEREASLMLRAIPEWEDTAKFQKDREDIVEMVRPYGIDEATVNSVADHRIALLYKHMLDMSRRINRAEQVKPVPVQPVKKPKGKPARVQKTGDLNQLVQAASRPGVRQELKDAAIAKLIGD